MTGGGPNILFSVILFSVPQFRLYRESFNDIISEYALVEMDPASSIRRR
jgi:hypothetical protein